MNKLEKSEQIIDLIIKLTDEGKLKWVEDGDYEEELTSYYCDINLLTGEVYHFTFIRDYYGLDITYEYPEMSSDTEDTSGIRFYFSELPTFEEKLKKLRDTIILNQQEAFDDLYTDIITVLSSMK